MKSAYSKGKDLLVVIGQLFIIASIAFILFIIITGKKMPWQDIAKISKIDALIIFGIITIAYLYHIYTTIFKQIK